MKRRELFGASVIGVGAAVANTACLTTGAQRGARDVDEGALRATLARIDEALEWLKHPAALDVIFRAHPTVMNARASHAAVRDAMHALTMIGMFGDLSPEERMHPEVQQRMWLTLPKLESVMATIVEGLRRLTRTELDGISAKLRDDPGLPMRVAEALSGSTNNDVVSLRRRAQVRMMVGDIAFRVRHQPASLLVDELVGRYDRLCQGAGCPAGTDVMIARAYDARRAVSPRIPEDLPWSFGTGVAVTGLVMCGLGILFSLSGLIIGTVNGVGVVGVTVGVILLILGLIVLAVGGGIIGYELLSKGARESEVQSWNERVSREIEAERREQERMRRERADQDEVSEAQPPTPPTSTESTPEPPAATDPVDPATVTSEQP